jgi:hypothetical protein
MWTNRVPIIRRCRVLIEGMGFVPVFHRLFLLTNPEL